MTTWHQKLGLNYRAVTSQTCSIFLPFKTFTTVCKMASQIKHTVAKNFYEALQSKISARHFNDFFGRFQLLRSPTNQIIWNVNLSNECDTSLSSEQVRNIQEELIEKKIVKNITLTNLLDKPTVQVELDVEHFIKDVLNSDPTKHNYQVSPKKIVVEFSSPNIAKPFHMGHLRSTIIGNSLANIKKKFGNNVVKMNYLGDWGTQFGMIQLGMDLENYTEEVLKKNPLETLFKAYVIGNAKAEESAELYEKAKAIFLDLENGKEDITQLWSKYRNWTLEELRNVYNRLGVTFDEYSWESNYKRAQANGILKMLEKKGILSEDKKGRKVAVIDEKEMPLLKSDNTTLYLLRDLVALEDRRSRFGFDEMYYVVENGQSDHFASLQTIASQLKLDEGVALEHVKFGRIQGMSTRKGRVTFLSDVLNECCERIYELQKTKKTTKVSLDNKGTAEILGVSAVIFNDLKKHRLKDYPFSWEKSLQLAGDTGVCVQYCHCRLCNLEIESGCSPASECDPKALMEPSAVNLISAIARYEEVLWDSNTNLEPCHIVRYVFDLVKAINVAYKNLPVKNAEKHVAGQRLLMFNKSREVLSDAMRLVGIKPLSKM